MSKLKFSREVLYELIWKLELPEISAQFNISKGAIRKGCHSMQIPLPSSSYWRNFSSSKVIVPSLSDNYKGCREIEIDTLESNVTLRKTGKSGPEYDLIVTILNDDSFKISLDQIAVKNADIKLKAKVCESGFPRSFQSADNKVLLFDVSQKNFKRVLVFMDVLVKLLIHRGHIFITGSAGESLIYTKEGRKFEIQIKEKSKKKSCINSYKKRLSSYTGLFTFKIISPNARKEWKDINILDRRNIARIAALIEFNSIT